MVGLDCFEPNHSLRFFRYIPFFFFPTSTLLLLLTRHVKRRAPLELCYLLLRSTYFCDPSSSSSFFYGLLQRIFTIFVYFCIHGLVFWRGIESLSLPFFSAIAFPDLLSYFVYLVLLGV